MHENFTEHSITNQYSKLMFLVDQDKRGIFSSAPKLVTHPIGIRDDQIRPSAKTLSRLPSVPAIPFERNSFTISNVLVRSSVWFTKFILESIDTIRRWFNYSLTIISTRMNILKSLHESRKLSQTSFSDSIFQSNQLIWRSSPLKIKFSDSSCCANCISSIHSSGEEEQITLGDQESFEGCSSGCESELEPAQMDSHRRAHMLAHRAVSAQRPHQGQLAGRAGSCLYSGGASADYSSPLNSQLNITNNEIGPIEAAAEIPTTTSAATTTTTANNTRVLDNGELSTMGTYERLTNSIKRHSFSLLPGPLDARKFASSTYQQQQQQHHHHHHNHTDQHRHYLQHQHHLHHHQEHQQRLQQPLEPEGLPSTYPHYSEYCPVGAGVGLLSVCNDRLQQYHNQPEQRKQNNAMSFNSKLGFRARKINNAASGSAQNTLRVASAGSNENDFNCRDSDEGATSNSLVIVSKGVLSDLTNQIAFSLNKMRDLEEQVKVIPELQRRIDHVINSETSNINSCNYVKASHQSRYSLQSTPVKVAPLDCGCSSIKEHLKYNSMSREQRLNMNLRSQSALPTGNSNNNGNHSNGNLTISPQVPAQASLKVDASTNTTLTMTDIFTRNELNVLLKRLQINSMTQISHNDASQPSTMSHKSNDKTYSLNSNSNFSTISDHKSPLPNYISSDSCGDEEDESILVDKKTLFLPSPSLENPPLLQTNIGLNDNKSSDTQTIQQNNQDDESDSNEETGGSSNGEEPFSLGSSYQDPSDFEEYCAYSESLDRRTKEFLSHSTKISNDLRFALFRLNDFIIRKQSLEQITSSSGCIDIIRKEWFTVSANNDSKATTVKLYVDYFESFTKQLLNTVVNLTDNAGNTAIHYAASHYNIGVIEVLLKTKVCDVNCRNKAGYTPIMLLSLANIIDSSEQDVIRQLFSMGDVNIKDRSSGQTALMLAAGHGKLETCKLLIECGADPSLQDCDGSTALMCGSEIGNEEIVKCLLAHKLTDPSATDNDGLDALAIAMNNGHKNVGLILYAAKNVPRMLKTNQRYNSSIGNNSSPGNYLCPSLRKSRAKLATNLVRRADSLMGARSGRSARTAGQ